MLLLIILEFLINHNNRKKAKNNGINALQLFSDVLGMNCSVDVIIPQAQFFKTTALKEKKYKTLYLLHGLSDDHTTWKRRTYIERYVEGKDLAVVMPCVNRSFYTEKSTGVA